MSEEHLKRETEESPVEGEARVQVPDLRYETNRVVPKKRMGWVERGIYILFTASVLYYGSILLSKGCSNDHEGRHYYERLEDGSFRKVEP